MTRIYKAALQGDLALLEFLLKSGANPNDCGFLGLGNPPLYAAALGGHEQAIYMLLEYGAKIDLYPSIVSVAAERGNYSAAVALIGKGAHLEFPWHDSNNDFYRREYVDLVDPFGYVVGREEHIVVYTDATNIYGQTALHYDSARGDTKEMRMLIKAGADVNAKAFGGITPLHEAVEQGNYGAVDILLRAGANVHSKADLGVTALHRAAARGHKGIAEMLLAYSPNEVNAQTAYGETPMHWAAHWGQVEVITKLQIWGGAIDARDADGYTPLHDAILNKQVLAVKYLLSQGANPHLMTYDHHDAVDLAQQVGDMQILYLVQYPEQQLFRVALDHVQDLYDDCYPKEERKMSDEISLDNELFPEALLLAKVAFNNTDAEVADGELSLEEYAMFASFALDGEDTDAGCDHDHGLMNADEDSFSNTTMPYPLPSAQDALIHWDELPEALA